MDIEAYCSACQRRLAQGDLVIPVQRVVARSGHGLWAEISESRAWAHLKCPTAPTPTRED